MARKVKLGLNVDERTSHMSDEALFCRKHGHKWGLKALSRKRFLELVEQGHQEDNRFCENGCGGTWRQLWDVHTGEVLENDRDYPKNGEYLMPPGSGRLHRNAARVAQFARQYREFA
jgi:hypothetical protein